MRWSINPGLALRLRSPREAQQQQQLQLVLPLLAGPELAALPA